MKRLVIAVALAFLGASAAPAPGETTSDDPANDVRAVLQAQQESWNRGDIDGFMNGYAHTDSIVFVSGDDVTRGWQTVRDRYKAKYSDRARMGELTFSNLEITLIDADAALADGRWKLKRASDQPHGRFTLLLRRLPEGWRIVHDHTSSAP